MIKVGDTVIYDGNLAIVKSLPSDCSMNVTIEFKNGLVSVVNKWDVRKMISDEFDGF